MRRHEFRTRRWPHGSWILWPTASLVFLGGLWPLMTVGPVADDLEVLARGSNILIRDGHWALISTFVGESIVVDRFLPVGGLLTAIYVDIAHGFAYLGLPLTMAWGLQRGLMILAATGAAVFAYSSWPIVVKGTAIRRSRDLFRSFSLCCGLVLVLIQVHAVWSNDPVISYPLAGWGSAVLGLVFIGTLGRFVASSHRATLWALTAVALAIAGSFNYELMTAASLATASGLTLCLIAIRVRRRRVFLAILIALLPIIVFGSQRLLHLSGTATSGYSGTSGGHTAWILPVWLTSMAGNVPFANFMLSKNLPQSAAVGDVILPCLSVALLIMLAFGRRPADARGLNPPTWRSSGLVMALRETPFLGTCATYWAASSLIYASSQKYQVEIGVVIGHVYMSFAIGCICLAISLTAIANIAEMSTPYPRPFRRLYVPAAAALLVAAVGYQWSLNGRSLEALRTSFEWTSTAFNSLSDPGYPGAERCQSLAILRQSDLPAEQKVRVETALRSGYRHAFATDLCPDG